MGAGGSSALQELRDVAANYDEHAGQGAHEHDLRALLQPKTSRLREQAQGFRRRLSKRLSKQQLETIVPAGGESENDSSAEAAEEAIYLQSLLRDNASIRDGLSGEQLDIRGQCVSMALVNTAAEDTRTITDLDAEHLVTIRGMVSNLL